MDGVRPGDFCGGEDAVHFQIAVLAGSRTDADRLICQLDVHGIHIRLGIDRHGLHAEFPACTDDAEGYFTAVCDQDAFEHNVGGGKWEIVADHII